MKIVWCVVWSCLYLVVFVDAEPEDIFLAFDGKLLVDLVFDGEAVTIPAEAARDVVSG